VKTQLTDAQKSATPGRLCACCGEDSIRVFLIRDVDTNRTRVSLLCRPCLIEYRDMGGELKSVHLVGNVRDENGGAK
jgi:hypothetical protein